MEADFRNVVVAEQLIQLSQSGRIPQGKTILLIYPEEHWKQIKKYMQDDEKRLERLRLYKQLLAHEFPSLFLRLHYPNGVYDSSHEKISLI